MHETVAMHATTPATIRAIARNEFGNVVIDVDLDAALDRSAVLEVEAIDGLGCTVLHDRAGTELTLVVEEFLAYATDDWHAGRRALLTLRRG